MISGLYVKNVKQNLKRRFVVRKILFIILLIIAINPSFLNADNSVRIRELEAISQQIFGRVLELKYQDSEAKKKAIKEELEKKKAEEELAKKEGKKTKKKKKKKKNDSKTKKTK